MSPEGSDLIFDHRHNAADRARLSHARFCGNYPYMRSGAGVPEPGFDVEDEVRGAGITGCAQPLMVLAASAAVARAARWSSTVFRPAPMVLTDRCGPGLARSATMANPVTAGRAGHGTVRRC
jgi:hypothetical protein